MHRRTFSALALVTALILAAPLGSRAQDRTEGSDGSRSAPSFGGASALTQPAGSLRRDGRVTVVLQLRDAPATQVYAEGRRRGLQPQDTTNLVRAQLATVEREQQRTLAALQQASLGAQVLYRLQRVYNGIAVTVAADKLEQLRRLPGVVNLLPVPTHVIENASSVPLINAPRLWDDLLSGTPNTGRGISIGIIDTGIDYLHTDFGGTGSGYQNNDPTVVEPGSFPTAKVVGGYDFVGDDYDASDPDKATPQPDADPLDCNGHGTHVAGTAAGLGVNADGSTYRGAYGPGIDFASLRIGPGVAPEADLYALKVFGCDGSTNVTDLAIEWAVDPNGDGDFSDHLDVINMSLGSPFGSSIDSSAVASDNAAKAGVIVVASAGNEGDTVYITGSPAAATWAISVAASVDSTDVLDGVRVDASNNSFDGDYPASRSGRYDWSKPPVSGELVYPPSQRDGCQPFNDSNRALINGKIVLLDWTDGGCGSITRGANARQAGAKGFLLADNSAVFDLRISGDNVIPGYSMPKSAGDRLKSALAGGTVNVTLGLAELYDQVRYVDETVVDTLASFTSRGPRRLDSWLKPDLTAPGVSIFSAAAGSGNAGVSYNGTSMAAPHVAGAMALLRQMHPNWSVEELKALVINTANHDLRNAPDSSSPRFTPPRIGSGRIDLVTARDATALAYNAEDAGAVSVSFGAPEVIGIKQFSKAIQITNKSTNSQTFTLSYEARLDLPGVDVSLPITSVTLAPGQSTSVPVVMTANAQQIKHVRDQTLSASQADLPRHWLYEEGGYVLVSAGSEPALRVPVYAAPRPASAMRVSSPNLSVGTGDPANATLTLTGVGLNTGTQYPIDTLSLATVFELQHISPLNTSDPLLASADLRAVGVGSDIGATGTIDTTTKLYFAIATHKPWSAPEDVNFFVLIDVDRDGTPDFQLYNTPETTNAGDFTNVYVTKLINLRLPPGSNGRVTQQAFVNDVPASELNTQVFNTSVMVLPVRATALGLSNQPFDYQVVSVSSNQSGSTITDETPVLTYNIARPGVDASNGERGIPAYPDLPGTTVPLKISALNFAANRSQGVLVLHHQNTSDRQVDIVTLQGLPTIPGLRIWLPSVFNQRSSNP